MKSDSTPETFVQHEAERAVDLFDDCKEIARDLKVFRNTVREVPRSEETAFDYDRIRRNATPTPPIASRFAASLLPEQAANMAGNPRATKADT